MSNKSISKNYIFTLGYQVLTMITPLITTPYVSRILQPEGIGAYSYASSIATYFIIFGALSIGFYGHLEIAKNRDSKERVNQLFEETFALQSMTMLTAIIVYWIVFWFGTGSAGVMNKILIITLIAKLFDISWLLEGLEEFKTIAIRNLVVRLLGVAAIFLFVKEQSDLYKYVFLVQAIEVIGNLTLWKYVIDNFRFVQPDREEMWRLFKNGLPFFVPSLATSIYTVLDKTMIGLLTGEAAQNGYYEQANKIVQLLAGFVTSLSIVVQPRAAYYQEKGMKAQLYEVRKNAFNFILILTIPMVFGLISVSNTLIPLFLGKGYEECIQILSVLSVLILALGMDNLIGKQILMVEGMQKDYNIGIIAGACTNLVMNLLLIRKFGAFGAAISSAAAECVILLSFIWFSRKQYDYKPVMKKGMKYLTFSVLMVLLLEIIEGVMAPGILRLVIQMFVGGCTYLILLLCSKDEFVMAYVKMLRGKIWHY